MESYSTNIHRNGNIYIHSLQDHQYDLLKERLSDFIVPDELADEYFSIAIGRKQITFYKEDV